MHYALNAPHKTKEVVTGYYASADGKSLVVTGQRYHYLLPLKSDIKQILSWHGRSKVELLVSIFRVHADGSATIYYNLLVPSKAIGKSDKSFLMEIGFREETTVMRLIGELEGPYYAAAEVIPTQRFFKPYQVTIHQESLVPLPVRAALTPISITADGVLFIGGAALIGVFCSGSDIAGKICFPAGL